MTPPELTITISGRAGSGKTLVSQLMAATLQAYGIRVSLEDDNGGWTPTDAQRAGYLNKLRPNITIKTKQTGRPSPS